MTASDSASAHCRSSTTSTVGASGRPSVCRRRSTPSPRTRVEGSAPAPDSVDHSGTTRARVGTNACIDTGGRMPARAALSSASRTGRNGVSAEVALHRPTSTTPPRARAHAASSRTRRLFPMPAGPSTIVALPPLLTAPRNASSSRSRPTIRRARGDVRCGTSVKPTQSHAPRGRQPRGSNSGRCRPSERGSHVTRTGMPTVTSCGSHPITFVTIRTPSSSSTSATA